MTKFITTLLLSVFTSCVFAVLPTSSLLNSCATGISMDGAEIEIIPFDEINEMDNYWQGYVANYITFRGMEIGYAKKGGKQGVVLGGRVFDTSHPILLNISRGEYFNLLNKGMLDLSQPSDWYIAKENKKGQYLCIAMNRSMEQAIPLMYLISTATKDKKLIFYVGTASKKQNGR